jgi:hypothetical protein
MVAPAIEIVGGYVENSVAYHVVEVTRRQPARMKSLA